MEFWVGKIVWAIAAPSHLLVILLLWFLLVPGRLWLRSFFCFGIAFFLFAAMILPLGDWALVPLERCDAHVPLPAKVDGIVVLGGAADSEASEATHQAQLNGAANRVTAMLELMKAYPQAKVLYSGGSSSLKYPGFREAEAVKQLVQAMGLDSSRIIAENTSRNTAENAATAKATFSSPPGQNWLLVTSAYHLPRALPLFEHEGAASQTRFYPYPAGFATGLRVHFQFTFDLPGNLAKLDIAAKEYAGLVVNKILGRSKEILSCATP